MRSASETPFELAEVRIHASDVPLRRKLAIGAADDLAEQEADQVAEEVMNQSQPEASLLHESAAVQRKCTDCEDEELKRKPEGGSPATAASAPASVGEVLQSAGTPLEAAVRAFMEPRFGRDFSGVRIHTDDAAARSAAAVGAAAYTLGSHIAFAAGRYAPLSAAGRRLMAHELAHVVQQRTGAGRLRREPDAQALNAALTPPRDLQRAAEILNSFSPDDIKRALGTLNRGLIASIYVGAIENKRVGPDSAAAQAARPVYLDMNYENELKQRAWAEAAKFLNGFNADDIKARLSKRTDDEVQHLQDAALATPEVGDKSGVAIITAEVLSARKAGPTAATTAPAAPCTTAYARARSFKELIDLVRAAQSRLAAAGITATKDQIHALRGVYYGTTWSLDYSVEKSITRNEGFQRFTRPSEDPAKTVPPDVQRALDCGLFKALQDSQDMIDPGGRQVDFGHVIIGLDARYDPALSSNVKYPVSTPMGGTIDIDLGGTGTELVTWLGDLGGGAASLALKRVVTPSTSASTVFTGSDYGGSINLEGDVAASVVASARSGAVTAPSFPSGKSLADALENYLAPGAPGAAWKNRATDFLTMNGAAFDASAALSNRAALIAAFAKKIQDFGCNYLVSRAKDKRVTIAEAKAAASTHLVSSSLEVATAFVDALDDSHKTGGKIEATRFPSPTSGAGSACGVQLLAVQLLGP